jgi:predicted AAA+ superfamily ATPase
MLKPNQIFTPSTEAKTKQRAAVSIAMIDWNITYAAIWRQRQEYLRPVKQIDPVRLDQLLGIELQKQRLIDNTERFLSAQPANNALLWGARGTGKSSLVKALLNEYRDRGLRMIEVDKQDLIFLPEIVDDIREQPQRFVIYCDDLSFDSGDTLYKSLKSVLEGSIELPPENVLFYATSNRRHLLPEQMSDNLDTKLVDGEVHYSDTIEEKISLSDRFGLQLSFYPQHTQTYLDIIDSYFIDYQGNREALHQMALDFAHQHAAKNGRTAKQFYNAYGNK